VRILSAVKHQNIVQVFYAEETHSTLLMFLEYMEGVRNFTEHICTYLFRVTASVIKTATNRDSI